MSLKTKGPGAFKPFRISRQTCEKRIADAKLIGWPALAESWQRDLDRLCADPLGVRNTQERKD